MHRSWKGSVRQFYAFWARNTVLRRQRKGWQFSESLLAESGVWGKMVPDEWSKAGIFGSLGVLRIIDQCEMIHKDIDRWFGWATANESQSSIENIYTTYLPGEVWPETLVGDELCWKPVEIGGMPVLDDKLLNLSTVDADCGCEKLRENCKWKQNQ